MAIYRNRNEFVDDFVDPMTSLVESSGVWRLFIVSALRNLQYNVIKLKQYASKIKHSLSCSVKENTSIKTNYRVTVQTEPSLKKNQDDPCAICIQVYTGNEGTAEVLAYRGLLMSWGVHEVVSLGTHLPYLLERGRQQIADAVKLTLCKVLDCNIASVHFNKENMMQFALTVCQVEPSIDSKPMKLFFKVPGLSRGAVSLILPIPSITIIRDSYASNEELTKEELLKVTYAGLQRHIFNTACMDVSMLELVKISHPHVSLMSTGSINFKSLKIADTMFDLFNDIFMMNNDGSSEESSRNLHTY